MTVIDFEDGLELLKEHDIRVARARVVDSAEDAVGFAARRAIDLCLLGRVAERNTGDVESDLHTTSSIRHAYHRLQERVLALPTASILARRVVETGTDVVIDARDDAILGRIVEIRGGGHVAYGYHPLGEEHAKAMLEEFHAKHGIASSEARTRMLAHVLLRVSKIFENDAIDRITLDPVRVHDNSYHVLDVHVRVKRPLHLNPRIAPRSRPPSRGIGREKRPA